MTAHRDRKRRRETAETKARRKPRFRSAAGGAGGLGTGMGGRLGSALEDALRRDGVNLEVAYTTAPREAAGLMAAAIQRGHLRVAVAGGDGSIHEAVNGVLDAGDVRPQAGA